MYWNGIQHREDGKIMRRKQSEEEEKSDRTKTDRSAKVMGEKDGKGKVIEGKKKHGQ